MKTPIQAAIIASLCGCASTNNVRYNSTANAAFTAGETGPGGDIMERPTLLFSAPPIFPPGPRTRPGKFKLEITAEFVVAADGTPADIQITSSNDSFYNPLVIEALKKWRFKPATRNGTVIPMKMQVPFIFELRD